MCLLFHCLCFLARACIRSVLGPGVGWNRTGDDICFFKTSQSHSSLNFSVEFEYDDDTVFFALNHPFTYTLLNTHLNHLTSASQPNGPVISVKNLCRTLAGNVCPIVTITDFTSPPQVIAQRKIVCISARVHPGETCSSWMMKGILDFLTGRDGDARELRSLFVFKIVPMLNPDGVIIGNFRTDSLGKDLNRYLHSVSSLQSTVFLFVSFT